MIIRQANTQDLNEIASLVYASYQVGYRAHNLTDLADATTMGIIYDAIIFPINQMWVAVERKEIRGMIAVRENCLERVFISPEHQRQGVGAKMLDYAIQLINKNNYDYLYVDIVKENIASQLFFRKQGAILVDSYTKQIRNNIEVIMLRFYITI